jgi:hypothetical protein
MLLNNKNNKYCYLTREILSTKILNNRYIKQHDLTKEIINTVLFNKGDKEYYVT